MCKNTELEIHRIVKMTSKRIKELEEQNDILLETNRNQIKRIKELEKNPPAFSNVISQVCPTCKGSGEYDHGKGYKSVCYECKGNGKIRT